MEKICPFCGQNFQIRPNRFAKQRISTCGKIPCFGLGHQKESRKPVQRICKICGKLFTTCMGDLQRNKGHICSIQCYRSSLSGNRNPNWKGGIKPLNSRIRNSEKMVDWKRNILERDKYICFTCGQIGGFLHSHHILPFAGVIDSYIFYYGQPTFEKLLTYEPLWSLSNGITLCKKCHNELPRKLKNNEINIPPKIWKIMFGRIKEEGGLAFVAHSVQDVIVALGCSRVHGRAG